MVDVAELEGVLVEFVVVCSVVEAADTEAVVVVLRLDVTELVAELVKTEVEFVVDCSVVEVEDIGGVFEAVVVEVKLVVVWSVVDVESRLVDEELKVNFGVV